jgi:hypothetical protein
MCVLTAALRPSGALTGLPAAIGLQQHFLAETDTCRRYFDKLIIIDELQCLLEE